MEALLNTENILPLFIRSFFLTKLKTSLRPQRFSFAWNQNMPIALSKESNKYYQILIVYLYFWVRNEKISHFSARIQI